MPDKYSQAGILEWASDTFGPVALNPAERVMRFVEEAVEYGHACDLPRETLTKIIERVYSKAPGNIALELAQCGVTLKAAAEIHRVDLASAEREEIDRVHSIPADHWRKRQSAKADIGITGL